MSLHPQIALVQALLDAQPGGVAEPARIKGVFLYKLAGKMFAILSTRADAAVSLKCDPALAEMLREIHPGVGHRYHLDRRHWISVDLDGGLDDDELERLTAGSYALVRASLTKAQRAGLPG
jgi:predicted DNA-binding protein (MmcQ/YjbR family)